MPGDFKVEPGGIFIARVQIKDKDATGLFPQTKIYDSSDAVVKTVNLSHVANGLYTGTVTLDVTNGKYYTQTLIYKESGRITLSSFIAPDSDSIDVNYYIFRPQFGSGGGTEVIVKDLSEEELEKISFRVVELITPLIKNKSEFNPKKDIVKIEDTGVKALEKFLIQRINSLENKLPDNNIKPLELLIKKQGSDIKKDIKSINTGISKEFIESKLGSIPTTDDINKVLDSTKTIIIRLDVLSSITKAISGFKSFVSESNINSLNNIIVNINSIKSDISNINIKDLSPQIESESKKIDKKIERLSVEFEKIINKIIEKDGLDDKRAKFLVGLIAQFAAGRSNGNNNDLKDGIEFILNNSLK